MPVNLIGLGLLLAGVIFLVMGLGFVGGVVLWLVGVVCLVGGIGALFMTYQRRRRLAA
jgi:membrane-bound ClpP family serine protease